MYRIGILGSENSHAMQFASIFNGCDPKCETKYDDMRVVAIGGNYPEESEKVAEKCGVEYIAEKPEDMLGRVDAVMVTARDGKYHKNFAMPFIEAGIPAFIDKPFANSTEDALDLVRTAKKNGVPLIGGSSTKLVYDTILMRNSFINVVKDVHGGNVVAPLNMDNPYGGFYFYSAHLAEISMTIFGYNPKSVIAVENGGNVTALVKYDGFNVTNHWNDGCYKYTAAIYDKDTTVSRDIELSLCYQHECANFVDMLRNGRMYESYSQLVKPVVYLNAVKESYENGGKEVKIVFPEI